MYHIALRSLCEGSEEKLFLQEPNDRLMEVIDIANPSPDFTDKYLAAFREPLPEDETQAVLQDKLQSGWLVWGKTLEVSRMTGWDEIAWEADPLSKDGMKVFEEAIATDGWWQQVCRALLGGTLLTAGRRSLGSGGHANVSIGHTYRSCFVSHTALWHQGFRVDKADYRGLSLRDGIDQSLRSSQDESSLGAVGRSAERFGGMAWKGSCYFLGMAYASTA